jgi:2-iminobutanoate/2-iminopropanoate deaminase
MKQQVTADAAPGAPFLSQAIVTSNVDTIYVSGQVHALPDNSLVGDTTEEKVAQIMKNIETILKAAEATLNDIVKVIIYVTDMSVMPELNKVYPTYFSEPFPVREAVCVQVLPLGATIEISVVAAK